MRSLMNLRFPHAAGALALYCVLGGAMLSGLAWANLAFAQSRLNVVRVVVQKATATPRLGFDQASVTLAVGEILANPATSDQPGSKGAISYLSSDDHIVSVAADGRITAVAAGTATITATQAADLPAFEAGAGSYQVTVVGPLSASVNFASRSWLVGEPVGGAVVPVSGSGGIGKLRYAIAPALPTGLDFSADTGALAGSASAQSPLTTYTVTVTDGATPPRSATATFGLEVGPALRAAVNRANWTAQAGDALNDAPVSAIGGIGALSYAVAPALPAGLAMDGATGAITGTAAIASPSSDYTVTVSDSASPAHEVAGNFTLEIRGALTAVPFSSDRKRSAVGHTLSFRPVTATGGVGALHYAVAPALPAGLKLDEATGELTGAATSIAPLTEYTVTVTDSASPAHAAMASFAMEIGEMLLATPRVGSLDLSAGDRVAVAAPVAASGGMGTLHFEISPPLPAGLAMDASDGSLSGAAIGESVETVYTVTISDSISQKASATFSLRVHPALMTSVFNAGETHRVEDAVSYTPPTTWGGLPPYHYTVTPALPAGLAMNAGSGAITGTATAPSAFTTYTYTVTDSALPAHSATGTFSLMIAPRLTATVLVPVISVRSADTVRQAPVKAEGGLGLPHFSVQPPLPAGLRLDEASGIVESVAGAAIDLSPATEYTITVTDSATPVQSATARFTLDVHAGVVVTRQPALAPLPIRQPMRAYAPVLASGGGGALTYTVAPPLPPGLRMDPDSGEISGTPTAEQLDGDSTKYVVTVSDSAHAGNEATASFGLVTFEPVTVTPFFSDYLLMVGESPNPLNPYIPVKGGGAGGRPLKYRMHGGGLPAGLSLDPDTGIVSGTAAEITAPNTYALLVSDPAVPGALPRLAYFDLTIMPPIKVVVASDAVTGPAPGEPLLILRDFITVSGGTGLTSPPQSSDPFAVVDPDYGKPANFTGVSWDLQIWPRPGPATELLRVVARDNSGRHLATTTFTVTWPGP